MTSGLSGEASDSLRDRERAFARGLRHCNHIQRIHRWRASTRMTTIALAIMLVWVLAFLIWSASQSVLIPAAAAALVPLALWRRQSTLGNPASIVTLIAIGLVLLVVRLLDPYQADVADGVFPGPITLLLADYLLLVQVFVLLSQRVHGNLPAYLPSLGVATLFCAFNRRIFSADQPLFLTLAIAVAIGCGLLSSLTIGPHRLSRSLTHTVVVSFLIGLSALGAWGVTSALSAAVPRVQMMLPLWIARSETFTNRSRSYVRTGTLSSINAEKLTDPMKVSLRVRAKSTPGYLRGLAYDTYTCTTYRDRVHSQWQLTNHPEEWKVVRPADQNLIEAALSQSQNMFAIHDSSPSSLVEMEVENDPTRGRMFFTPLATSLIRGEGTFLVVDQHEIVHTGIRTSTPYSAYTGSEAVVPGPSETMRNRLLHVPPAIDSRVHELAHDICRSADAAQQKIDAVVGFLRDEFEYADEGLQLPRDVEQLSYFLLNQSPAHCEFFASGAVMLLRSQGVPCRYVTGYVVAELDGDQRNSWIARNQNAHAWAEAYDDDRQQWVVVEATPGMSLSVIDSSSEEEQSERAMGGGDADGGGEMELNDGWLATIFSTLARLKYYGLALGVALCFVLYRFQVQRRQAHGFEARIVRMQRSLARLEKKLRRRNLGRRPNETLHEFASRLRRIGDEDVQLQECADWYLQYAILRYAGEQAQGEASLPALPL